MSELQEKNIPQPEVEAKTMEVGFEPLNLQGVDLDNQKEGEQIKLGENDPNEEKLNKKVLDYIEINKNGEGNWQVDFEFAQKLAEEGKLELALKLALLAREAQIKEGPQKETPTEEQLQ